MAELQMICIEISPQTGYQSVLFTVMNTNTNHYCNNQISVMCNPDEEFTLNASYDLDLQIVAENVLPEAQFNALRPSLQIF